MSSKPIRINTEGRSLVEVIFHMKWAQFNCYLFDSIQRRKLKQAILHEDYRTIYNHIITYEHKIGTSKYTEKIKKYAIFNLINNEFINVKILEKA